MPCSLYVRDGEVVVPTELSLGPWSDDAQHGGPVAALLAGAAEACDPVPGMSVVRITVELLRPVPLRPHRVAAAVLGGGRSAQRVAVSLVDVDSGATLATALCLRMRRREVEVPPARPDAEPPPPERSAPPTEPGDRPSLVTHGLEMRFTEGAFESPGPAAAWFRLRCAVIDGEPVLPIQHALVAADCANGISGEADFSQLLFVNADLHLVLSRPPEGAWIHLTSRSRLDSGGTGLSQSTVRDLRGTCGASMQTLLIAARTG